MPLAGKRPLTPRGVYDASTDPNVWLQWVQQFPGCNIGLAVPEGCAVIDVDPRNGGGPTFDRLDDVEHAIPRDTLQVTTGGGGLHVFVALPQGYALPSTLGPGVDVKQLGGYVVAAPSVHPDTGQHYRVTRDAQVAHAPPSLAARAAPRGESRAKALAADEIDDVRRDAAGWGLDPDLVVQDVSPEQIAQAVRAVESIYQPGQRHHVRVKMGSVLNRLGWSAASVEAFGRALYEEYGGDNPHKIARETVRGMGYPSGYYELVAMAGSAGGELAAALDALPNPYGVHLREARAASAEDVLTRLAKLEAQAAANPDEDDGFFGWLADDADDVPIDPIIVGLDIADGRTTAIAGLPHAAKTPTSMALALCVANGVPWMGRETHQRPVVYLNFEKGFDAISKRRRIAQGLNVNPMSVHLLNIGDKGAFLTDKTGTIDKACAIVKRIYGKTGLVPLVILDTMSNACAGLKHNDAEYLEPLRTLCTSLRMICPVPVAVLMHCRKTAGENVRFTQNDVEGSGQLVGYCTAVIGLYKPYATKPSVITAFAVRAMADVQPDITFEWEGTKDTALTFRELDEKGDAKPVRERQLKRADRNTETLQSLSNLVEASPDGVTWSQEQLKIAAKVNTNRTEVLEAFRWAVKALVEDGRLQRATGKHGAITYRKTPAAEVLALRGDASRVAGLAPAPMYGGFGLSQNGPPLASNVLPFTRPGEKAT
jgi:RecA-family ATPase